MPNSTNQYDSPTAADPGNPSLSLVQDGGYLLGRKALLLHGNSSGPWGRIMPQLSHSEWAARAGAPHSAALMARDLASVSPLERDRRIEAVRESVIHNPAADGTAEQRFHRVRI